jgi:hypothetical protein
MLHAMDRKLTMLLSGEGAAGGTVEEDLFKDRLWNIRIMRGPAFYTEAHIQFDEGRKLRFVIRGGGPTFYADFSTGTAKDGTPLSDIYDKMKEKAKNHYMLYPPEKRKGILPMIRNCIIYIRTDEDKPSSVVSIEIEEDDYTVNLPTHKEP